MPNYIEKTVEEFEKKFIMNHGEYGKTLILKADLSELSDFLTQALTSQAQMMVDIVEGKKYTTLGTSKRQSTNKMNNEKPKIRVLSLFDGVSCARLALEKAGFEVVQYFASEIDEHAVKVVQFNRPDTIQLGNVSDIRNSSINVLSSGERQWFADIDLLIGGSPCQDLSVAKRDRKGLEGDKSGLFYEYVRILNEVKPKWFILENVATMDQTSKDIISKLLGVQPILIDAGLVSAQDRRRLFWTNIPGVFLPQDQEYFLKDIMEPVGIDITERWNQKIEGTLSFKKSRANLRTPEQKAKTLTASGQNISNSGATNIKMPDGKIRMLTPIECERLQGMPDNWTMFGLDCSAECRSSDSDAKVDGKHFVSCYKPTSKTQRYKMAGNAFNVDVVAYILAQIPREPWMDILPSKVNVMKLPPKIVLDDNVIKNGFMGELAEVEIYKPGQPLLDAPEQQGIPSPFKTEE